jgi:hypothetical protein
MEAIDIFNSDAFAFTTMVAAVNKLPMGPGRIGQMGLFSERPVATTTVAIEEHSGQLSLVAPTPRGGVGETRPKETRLARNLTVPHYQLDDAIMASEVQNVREFGTSSMRTIETLRNMRMEMLTNQLDATLEHQRIGAIKGIIVDKNANTIYNLFSEMGVTANADVTFTLSSSSFALRATCASIIRMMAQNLGQMPIRGVYALVGDTFWDALVTHAKVEQTYQYQEGVRLRDGVAYQTLVYGGITWENYLGYIAPADGGNTNPPTATQLIGAAEARFFPTGVPGLFETYFAPADYMETANTLGLPRYAKAFLMPNDKGMNMEVQTNPLSLCRRPRALFKGVLA